LCRGQGEKQDEGHARTLKRWFRRCFPKVLPGLHTTHGTVVLISIAVLGQSPTIPAATAAPIVAGVPSCSYYTTTAGISQATSATYTYWIPMLQLQENRPLRQGLPPDQAGQLTESRDTHGELAEGPTEEPNIAVWPCQLHHRRGDPH
jgi:hypothetical protein